MRIGGFQKFSIIDYPGKMAAVIFTQGCNFRCPYCQNAQLVEPRRYGELIPEWEVLTFLEKRQGKLEGVVVSGGEPTLQPDLISFLDQLKCLGYLVKLDTNGSHPEILGKVIDLRLINYVAMDIKAPLEKYSKVAGVCLDVRRIQQSIDIIINSGIGYEFRTTMVKSLCPPQDIDQIRSLIPEAERYTLQSFIPRDSILDKSLLTQEDYTPKEIQEFQHALALP